MISLTIFYPIIILASFIIIAIGFFGLAGNRNPMKMLLSIEVSFNGVLLLILYISWVFGVPLLGSDISIFAIGLSIGEIAIIMSVLISLFRSGKIRELDEEELQEEEED